MLKRTISGAVFVAIVTTFFLLREYVDYRLFDILIWFFMSAGTIELAVALKSRLIKYWGILWSVFGILFVPHYFFVENYLASGYGWLFSLGMSFAGILATVIFALIKKTGFKNFVVNCLGFTYPSLLILTMLLCNGFVGGKGFVSTLLIFVISPCADTFAYLVGMTYGKIKKGNVKKLCPTLSPNKTWAGAIGGLVGGAIGSLLVYFIFRPQFSLFNSVAFFAILGIVASVADELGDLFESYIKRKVGIKDMGKIMPGHGGVMDRIDGMIFTSFVVFAMFLFVV